METEKVKFIPKKDVSEFILSEGDTINKDGELHITLNLKFIIDKDDKWWGVFEKKQTK